MNYLCMHMHVHWFFTMHWAVVYPVKKKTLRFHFHLRSHIEGASKQSQAAAVVLEAFQIEASCSCKHWPNARSRIRHVSSIEFLGFLCPGLEDFLHEMESSPASFLNNHSILIYTWLLSFLRSTSLIQHIFHALCSWCPAKAKCFVSKKSDVEKKVELRGIHTTTGGNDCCMFQDSNSS